jgi:hypothetical protein
VTVLTTEPLDVKSDEQRGRMGLGRYPGKISNERPYGIKLPRVESEYEWPAPDFKLTGTITGRIPRPDLDAIGPGHRVVDDAVRDALGD